MNIQVRDHTPVARVTPQKLMNADCDVHIKVTSTKELYPYLEKRWIDYIQTFGMIARQGYVGARAYPKSQPNAARRDAWPPGGGRPGSNLEFLKKQLLDGCSIDFGVLNYVGENGQLSQNQDIGAAYCRAVNHWIVEEWTSKEPRLKGSIVVPYEDPDAAVKEIEYWAGNPNFVQIVLHTRSAEPYGQRRYRKMFEAAVANNLPVGIHAFGFGGYPVTSGGWPSYYIEEMTNHAQSGQSLLTSMVMEGLFEHLPQLRVVLLECGFAWLPSLKWRLDKVYKTLKQETPHLKRLPSEYLHDQVWIATQPMEESDPKENVLETLDWIGWDRIVFSSDYPHWDFDDPATVLPFKISPERRAKFFRGNAMELYGR